jgi:hypothetical protein
MTTFLYCDYEIQRHSNTWISLVFYPCFTGTIHEFHFGNRPNSLQPFDMNLATAMIDQYVSRWICLQGISVLVTDTNIIGSLPLTTLSFWISWAS